ncbi:Ion transport protein-domain-containing protein [Mycotypha africana]|uniref:Ion transport protein-domain-containing protein n=1 Tax=Mycotypha africana TaxID=64632 RepID=UPI0022FFDD29|nr:Ion transport protein-domain-containing protein [Mycotypha africana]KAI8991980.1 Ion transport protein-domain-containing protein [Mycotypha africana]
MTVNESNESDDLQLRVEDDSSSPSFMTFTPKLSHSLSRRYTQKKQPVNATEFMNSFDQQKLNSTLSNKHTGRSSISIMSYETLSSTEDADDVTDTARLTLNASALDGRNNKKTKRISKTHRYDSEELYNGSFRLSVQQERPVSRFYEPAYIDMKADQRNKNLQEIISKTTKEYLNAAISIIQKTSKRVINLHDISNQQCQQLHSTANVVRLHDNNLNKSTEKLTYRDSRSANKDVAIQQTVPVRNLPRLDSALCVPSMSQSATVDSIDSETELYGHSLKIFSPTNTFRLFLFNILRWRWLEPFLMLLIVFHGIVLLIVGWGNNPFPVPPQQWVPTWDQLALLIIFSIYTVIIIARSIVYGFIINSAKNGKRPFLRHSWNRIDFVSVLSYWIDFILLLTHQEMQGETQRILVFRMLSALILLRLLNLTDGNKVILNSLKKAAPLLVNVLFFVLFFFVVFAIVGIQSFKGSFKRHCVWHDPNNTTNVQEVQQYCGGYINGSGAVVPYRLKDGTEALWSKGFICEQGLICEETDNPFGGTISFDNIFSSMLIVMIITGVQSWTDRMYDMMDAEYFVACLYFVVIVIVMNFWLVNLFIAVITEMFAKVREDSQHSAFTNSKAKPVLADSTDGGWAFSEEDDGLTEQITRNSLFNRFVKFTYPFWIFLVLVDLVCMAAKNNNMSRDTIAMLDEAEIAFTIAFLIEILLRLMCNRQDLKGFFRDTLNLTDFCIAIITCIIQIPPVSARQNVYVWLTGFQVLRSYRLVVAIPRLRKLMSRVLGSLHGLINLSFFIVLATLLCAIIAFQLFEGVINELGEEMRFFSVYNSFTALYQLFSGEDWTTILYNVMDAGSENHNSTIYALFLVFWFAFSNFVLVNLFIAVLMENFEIAEEDKQKRQIFNFMQKTENELDKDVVISRWNIYRYFKPKAKGLSVKDMPSSLTISTQKSIVREFMMVKTDNSLNRAPSIHRDGSNRDEDHRPMNLFDRAKNFLNQILSTSKDAAEQQRQQKLRPSLRESLPNKQNTETTTYDIEERRALRRDFINSHPTYDRSLYVFSNSNRFRRWCQLIVQPSRGERIFGTPPLKWVNIIFSAVITSCVLVNVILTIYNSPVYQFEHRDNPSALLPFKYCDWAFTIIFSIEFVIKIVADGFGWTPNAYLLNGWNLLDLFVLITLYMSNFGTFAASTGLERGFRAFKALRALRLINLLKPAKEAFTAILVTGLSQILDAAVLGLCLIVPFALYGKNVFMGLFYFCNDGDNGKTGCIFEALSGTQEPMPEDTSVYMPRIWDNPYVYSFDSFWKSLLILFEICSGEGWIDVLTTSMGITGKDEAPQQDASQLWGIFFMVYNLAGSVFVISLFLGVVIENFTKRNGTAYMTTDQRRWLDLKKLLNQIRPAKRPKIVPQNKLRKLCYNLTVEKRGRFYKFMTVIISLNILFLCTDTARDSDNDGINSGASGWIYVYLAFIFIYWIEILIKLLGLGWHSFRQNLWNLFDLGIVIGSFITAIITLGNSTLQVNVESQKLFMTAFCFKLVQRSDSLNQLFTTMAASSYQIFNVFAVWFVVLTTYAIMFMQIFGLTKYGPSSTTEHMNFRTYSNTMISLIRYSTGEGWNSIMHDFTVEYPNCVVADNYLDSDCGSLRWSYFLFLTFNIISMYIFIAIFVAVVTDNFSYVYQIKANFSLVNRDEIRKYPFSSTILSFNFQSKMTWASIDTDRTGYIKPNQYMSFWRKLDGIFKCRIFEPEYSYKALVKGCRQNSDGPYLLNDPYEHNLDLAALNEKLKLLDKRDLHSRRQDLEKLYWETALIESTTKGVTFNQMLLMLAQRKLIIPEKALLLEELLENQRKEEAINTLISIDRVRGLIETIALRKKFLKHLESKRHKKASVPIIRVDKDLASDSLIAPPLSPFELVSSPDDDAFSSNIGSCRSSLNPFSDNYHLSSDDDGLSSATNRLIGDEQRDRQEGIENMVSESLTDAASVSHSLWQEMLQNESK